MKAYTCNNLIFRQRFEQFIKVFFFSLMCFQIIIFSINIQYWPHLIRKNIMVPCGYTQYVPLKVVTIKINKHEHEYFI